MGNYLYTGSIKFHLAREQFEPALMAIIDAAESYNDGIEVDRADRIVSYIANTTYTKDPIEKQLVEVIALFDWSVTFNERGNIDDIFLTGDYSGDEEALFTLLGPYITQGSHIILNNTEFDYRYAFTGTRMLEQEPHYDPVPDEREKGVEV